MKWLVIAMALAVSGCSFSKRIPDFPPASERMMQKCPDLALAPNSELLSDLVRTVITNYGEYHKCKALVDAWQDWYQQQKKIYEDILHE